MADDQDTRSPDKQTGFDDAGNLIERYLKPRRVINCRHMQVKDHVSRLGLKHRPMSFAKDSGSS